jgi:hypothetical protein
VHEIVPVWHGLAAGVQLAPDEHALHVPEPHTWPAPHDVPSGTFVPVSLQTGAPVVHAIEPV